jgi:hypothetical protein
MATLHNLMAHAGGKDPQAPNGLQVRGREEVKLLVSGVSSSLRLFEGVLGRQADAVSRARSRPWH